MAKAALKLHPDDNVLIALRDLRKEVASLSVMAAEKLLRKSVDDGVQKSVPTADVATWLTRLDGWAD